MQFTCSQCQNQFERSKRNAHKIIHRQQSPYCSKDCFNQSQSTGVLVNCKQCNTEFIKLPNQIAKCKNHFCSHSCNATYQNAHKTTGNRRSKLEGFIQAALSEQFPDLEILFNDKSAINSELDIYVPSLRLAFELNGIFHYEPIYGADKLSQIQNNDQRKFQACIERGIALCIIDTSQQNYVKLSTSQKYIDIVCNIVEQKISESNGCRVLAGVP